MPELPEVVALAADLDGRLAGRVVERLDVVSFAALKTVAIPPSALTRATITAVGQHGKFLDLSADTSAAARAAGAPASVHLVLHLARAGWVRWRAQRPAAPTKPGRGPIAARLVLDDGAGVDVTEYGTKKSLALSIVADPHEVPRIDELGPEPLDEAFTLEVFTRILRAAGRRHIKGVLRDQRLIAGIGNAWSDEILHAARLSPYKPATMTDAETATLYDALRSTLREALDRELGTPAADLKGEKKRSLRVHGRTGEPCPVCGDTVREVIFHDSTFQYCPTCQTGGTPLADRVLSRLLK